VNEIQHAVQDGRQRPMFVLDDSDSVGLHGSVPRGCATVMGLRNETLPVARLAALIVIKPARKCACVSAKGASFDSYPTVRYAVTSQYQISPRAEDLLRVDRP
jgi:hypothetical protein